MKISAVILLISVSFVFLQAGEMPAEKTFRLDSVEGLELLNVKAEVVEHQGKTGVQVTKAAGEISGETLVVIPGLNFANGTISVELTGEPAPDADPQMRGFVGVAFRVDPENYASYDCLYLRPTNARSNNQIRRNHTTQYIAHPEFPWYRMRKEFPELYESYADLVPGDWTKLKIEVAGTTAKLYLHDNDQPCLIVNDLKHEEKAGKIALWLHSSTLARYRNLVVKPN